MLKMKILIIDDEELICWSLKRSIEKYDGYSVTCVHSGKEAIEKAVDTKYDLIITDLKLPDLSGADIVKKLREMKIDTPVVMMSAFLSNEVKSDIINYGVVNFINKPFQIEEIIGNINKTSLQT